jgi:hypothetical protein
MNFSRAVALSVTLLILSACGLLAQPRATGTLSGRLTVKDNLRADAIVNLYFFEGHSYTATFSTRTDKLGEYRFSNLANGQYILLVLDANQRIYQGQATITAGADITKDIAIGGSLGIPVALSSASVSKDGPIAVFVLSVPGLPNHFELSEALRRQPIGIIYELSPRAEEWLLVHKFTLQIGFLPTDIQAVVINGKAELFISMNAATTGRVYEYSTQGNLLRYWTFSGHISGLSFDEASQVLYVASWAKEDIYSINIRADAKVKWIGRVPSGPTSRPIVLHADGKRLYVPAENEGNLYEFDLEKRRTRIVAKGVGTPAAFLISYDHDLLYFVNSQKGKLYSLKLSDTDTASRPSEILVPGLQTPSGLARLSNDKILISDRDSGSVVVLSEREPDKILYSYPTPSKVLGKR